MLSRLAGLAGRAQARAMGARAALFGAGGIKSKLGLTAGYLGAAGLTNAYISHVADIKRGYYGDSRYESYYGQGAENLSSLVTFGGIAAGAGALMGRDPISRARGTYRYWVNEGSGVSGRALLNSPSVSGGVKNRIRATPRFGALQAIAYSSLVVGTPATQNPELALGALGLMGAGLAIKGASKATGLPGVGFAASIGAASLGGYIGYRHTTRNPNPAAEGNITSFNENSVVSKMNWSTSGLTLALHRNNRKVI